MVGAASEEVPGDEFLAADVEVELDVVRGEFVELFVQDDGSGGADLSLGTGLRGLADRVQEFGGTLRLDSPAGRGTTIAVEFPCAS